MSKKTTKLKLQDALTNAQDYIAQMSQWDDKKLERHLTLFMQQKEMAYKANNQQAVELLQQYEEQVITARLLKS